MYLSDKCLWCSSSWEQPVSCGAAAVLLFTVIQANTLTVMCRGCDPACGCQTEVLEDFERLRGGKLCRKHTALSQIPPSLWPPPCSCLSVQRVGLWASCCSIMTGAEKVFCVCVQEMSNEKKPLCILASLLQFLHVSLTAVYQTGVSSSNPRQSHRVHPVHEAEKSHAPAGYRRPEEAERPAGAARYLSTARYHDVLQVGDTWHDIYSHLHLCQCTKGSEDAIRFSLQIVFVSFDLLQPARAEWKKGGRGNTCLFCWMLYLDKGACFPNLKIKCLWPCSHRQITKQSLASSPKFDLFLHSWVSFECFLSWDLFIMSNMFSKSRTKLLLKRTVKLNTCCFNKSWCLS